jgi:hypothetical protein
MKPFKILGWSLIVLSLLVMILFCIYQPHEILDAKDPRILNYTQYNTTNAFDDFSYGIANNDIKYQNGWPTLIAILIAGLLMSEGIIILLAKNTYYIFDDIVTAKIVTWFGGSFFATFAFIISPMFIHGILFFSFVKFMIFFAMIVGGILVLCLLIYTVMKLEKIIDAIIWFFTHIGDILFGWYFRMNEWLIEKSTEEDKRGNRYKRSRK